MTLLSMDGYQINSVCSLRLKKLFFQKYFQQFLPTQRIFVIVEVIVNRRLRHSIRTYEIFLFAEPVSF